MTRAADGRRSGRGLYRQRRFRVRRTRQPHGHDAIAHGLHALESGIGFTFGWYPDGVAGENQTLESGATATWTTSALAAGTYTVYADYSLTDQNGNPRQVDSAAQYVVTYPGGTQTFTVDQGTAVGGQLALGSITTSGPGQVQVQLTRGAAAKATEWTMAQQVEFVSTGPDVVVGSPTLTSFATQTGVTTLAPGGYVVLVSDFQAFDFRYHIAANNIPVVGVYSGHQSDDGEAIGLFQAGPADAGTGYIPYFETDLVDYSNAAPWPTEPAGGGPGLVRLRAADYGNDPDNWMASNVGGTPGAANLAIDRLPPTVPANLAAAALLDPGRINLTWTASLDARSDVDHYVIYRDGASIGTSPTNSFADTTIQTGTNYTYAVSAVNRDGYESAQSAAIVSALPGITSYEWLDSKTIEIYFNEPLAAGPASTLANYAMTGGITFAGVALSRDNTRVTLTTNQAAVASTSYTLNLNNLTTVSGGQLPANQQLTFTFQLPTGSILLKYWANLDGGNTINDLTNPALNPNYPNNPTTTSYLTSFEAPSSTGLIDYGEKIVGYIYPPTTGNYVFWIASDDYSQLWLSTTSSPNNAVMIASVSGATGFRQWNAYASQQSASIPLVAGQRYYIYALQKQGAGGDNLSVAWQLPGTTFNTSTGTPIPGTYLAPYGGNVDLTPPAAPTNLRAAVTGANNQITLNWSGVVDLTSGIDHYAIYRDGQIYSSSTTTSFIDSSGISSLTPHSYQVAAVNYDGVQGPLSTALRVGPVGIASIVTPSTTIVAITFTEPVDPATAQVISNYQISGVSVTSATLQSGGVTVILTTSALGSGSHSLAINNAHRRGGAAMPALSGAFSYGAALRAAVVHGLDREFRDRRSDAPRVRQHQQCDGERRRADRRCVVCRDEQQRRLGLARRRHPRPPGRWRVRRLGGSDECQRANGLRRHHRRTRHRHRRADGQPAADRSLAANHGRRFPGDSIQRAGRRLRPAEPALDARRPQCAAGRRHSHDHRQQELDAGQSHGA